MPESQNWYAGNATRAYPFELSDLPHDLVVDLTVRIPGWTGEPVTASVAIGPRLVHLGLAIAGEALAYISLLKEEVVFGQAVALISLGRRTSGWVTFGRGVQTTTGVRANVQVLPRCIFGDNTTPVTRTFPNYEGEVEILAGNGIEVLAAIEEPGDTPDYFTNPRKMRKIDGSYRPAIVVRMAASTSDFSTLTEAAGSCGNQADGLCGDYPPIRRINSVAPNCDGVLRLKVQGTVVSRLTDGAGIVLEDLTELQSICAASTVAYTPIALACDITEVDNSPVIYPDPQVVVAPGEGEAGTCQAWQAPFTAVFSDLSCTTTVGTWDVNTEHILTGTETDNWATMSFMNSTTGTANLITYIAVDSLATAGLMFGKSGSQFSYAVIDAAAQKVRLGRRTATDQVLAETAYTIPYYVSPTWTWVKLEVKLYASGVQLAVEVYVNDTLVSTSSDIPALRAGRVGLLCKGGVAHFDGFAQGQTLVLATHGAI